MKRAAERKAQALRRFHIRSALMLSAFAIAAIGLVGKSIWVVVVDRDDIMLLAEARHLRTITINPSRGSIVDRNGEPMAVSTPVDSIGAIPKTLAPAIDEFQPLAEALGANAEQLMRRVSRSMDKEFVFLARRLRPSQVEAVNALQLPGIDVRREYKRYYPAGEVAVHLVGMTDIEDIGQEGLEKAFNAVLAGEPGAKRVLRDRKGHVIEEVESIRSVRHGQTLASSIDLRLQYFAHRELKRAASAHRARSGSVVVLDVKTGEVLAMVNWPATNPNNRAALKLDAIKNRAVLDNHEPGSAIKPLIVAAALSTGVADANAIIDTSPGKIQVGAKSIEDKNNLGPINLATILSRSSNVGMTKVALRMEPEQMWRVLDRFGFGQPTGGGFLAESSGLLSHHSYWRDISQATISYGYGLTVTPLQLARAYAALGNDGVLPQISLLANPPREAGVRVVDAEVADAVLGMMEQVVGPGGTARKAAIPGYRVAGKTGTSKKSAVGGYADDRYLSVFAGLVPVSEPRFAAVVVLDEPSGDAYYGGDVAAPVFSVVMREALRLFAVAPDDSPAIGAGAMQAAR
ncbi:MAG: penicillin-binding transpeptidase domain-containing protein [Pseudomonadota bacterium]